MPGPLGSRRNQVIGGAAACVSLLALIALTLNAPIGEEYDRSPSLRGRAGSGSVIPGSGAGGVGGAGSEDGTAYAADGADVEGAHVEEMPPHPEKIEYMSDAILPVIKGAATGGDPFNYTKIFPEEAVVKVADLDGIDEGKLPLDKKYVVLALKEYNRGVVRNQGDYAGFEDVGQRHDLAELLSSKVAGTLSNLIVDPELIESGRQDEFIEQFRRQVLDSYMTKYAIIHTSRGMAEIKGEDGRTFWTHCMDRTTSKNKTRFVSGPDHGEEQGVREDMYEVLSKSTYFMDTVKVMVDAIPDEAIVTTAKAVKAANGAYKKDVAAWEDKERSFARELRAAKSPIRVAWGSDGDTRPLRPADLWRDGESKERLQAEYAKRVLRTQEGGAAFKGYGR